ncbi:hypothetical protein ACFL6K_01630 [Candidatus Latescibacterota bacterium]
MIKASIGQRRWYFIKTTFNFRLLLLFLVIMIIGASILGFMLYYLSSSELDVKLFEAHSRIMSSWEILSPTIFLAILSSCILILFILLIIILSVSHKIVGPLYKFEMIAEQIGKGNFQTNVRLRKKDKIIHLQNAIENMMYSLNGKIKNFKRNYLKIKKTEDELINAVNSSSLSDDDKIRLSKKVKELIAEYESNLNRFSLRELDLSKLQQPYNCPVHEWIGICPDYEEVKDLEYKDRQVEENKLKTKKIE